MRGEAREPTSGPAGAWCLGQPFPGGTRNVVREFGPWLAGPQRQLPEQGALCTSYGGGMGLDVMDAGQETVAREGARRRWRRAISSCSGR